MEQIISFLQEIFMGKENNTLRVGLSQFKTPESTRYKAKRKSIFKSHPPKELRLSELMHKG